MKRWAILAIAGLTLTACQDASAPDSAIRRAPTGLVRTAKQADIPGSYIVTLRDDVKDIEGAAKSLSLKHKGALKHIYKTALRGFALTDLTDAEAVALAQNPLVKWVEADQVMTMSTNQPDATWGLDRVDQRDRTPTDGYNYFANGSGVTVYIIDTGIDLTNADFGGRAVKGIDEVTANGPATDCNGHGTHVSGTVGGATYGIAKNVHLVAVRVLDCNGSGTTSGVIAGINWAASDHQSAMTPASANMSLGGGVSASLNTAVANAVQAGITFAVAAGNSTADACNSSPSSEPSAITVGATDINDVFASFSNYGKCVDINAPGVNITSDWNNGAPNTISGTSMATPHVTGAAALYLSVHPGALPGEVTAALVNNATPNKITGIPGTGTPNLLLYTAFIISGPPGPPVARFTFSCTGLACNFDGSASSADVGATFTWDFGDQTTPFTSTTSRTASHTFATAGTRTVTLTVTNLDRQAGSVSRVVAVAEVVNSVARFTKSCSSRTCSFDASTSTNATSYGWNFGDGSTASGVTTSHRFARNTSYTVTLTTQPGNSTATIGVTCTNSCR